MAGAADNSSSGSGGSSGRQKKQEAHASHPKPDVVSHYTASALSAVLNFPLWCVCIYMYH